MTSPSEKRIGEIEERLKDKCGKGASCDNHGDLFFLLSALKASREVVEAARAMLDAERPGVLFPAFIPALQDRLAALAAVRGDSRE